MLSHCIETRNPEGSFRTISITVTWSCTVTTEINKEMGSFGRQKTGIKFYGIRISGLLATKMVDKQRRDEVPKTKLLLFSKLAIKTGTFIFLKVNHRHQEKGVKRSEIYMLQVHASAYRLF